MKLQRNDELIGELKSKDGQLVVPYKAKVSPCSWMYPAYGLQLQVTLENGSNAFVRDRSIMFADAVFDDAYKLVADVRVCACTKCGKPALDPATCETNRDAVCEACFLAQLRAELDADQKAEAEKVQKLDAEYKAQGFTHRVDAWIHPRRGDDLQISFWMVEPTAKRIVTELRKAGCTMQNDYQVFDL